MATIEELLTQQSVYATNLNTQRNALADNLVAKGVTATHTELLDTLVPKVLNITSGGTTTDGWTPNSTWWDIKTILQNDVRSYLGKWICLIPDSDISTILTVNSKIVAYATSDGAFYTTTTTHTWDTTKDKTCNEGYKTRYIIYYNNSASTPANTSFNSLFAYIKSLYIVLDINIAYGASFLQSSKILQSFNFINNKNFNTVNMSQFCNECISLRKLPDINTANVVSYDGFCSGCYSLQVLPSINTSSGTLFYQFCYQCTTLTSVGEINFINLTDMRYFLSGCTSLININITHSKLSFDMSAFIYLNHISLLNIINGLVDLSSLTSQTLTLGATLLAKLTTDEKAIATNKNWVLA